MHIRTLALTHYRPHGLIGLISYSLLLTVSTSRDTEQGGRVLPALVFLTICAKISDAGPQQTVQATQAKIFGLCV